MLVAVACSSEGETTVDAAVTTTSPPPTTATTLPLTTTTTAPAGVTLFDFAEPGSVEGWANVDDTVMGGVSASSATWEDGALVFGGFVSLDNNGGFTSVVSPRTPGLADPALASGAAQGGAAGSILVAGAGDGRNYVLQLRATGGGQQLWTQTFTLPAEGGVAGLPLSGFAASDFRLEPVAPAPVDLARIEAIAIYLADGVAGPFRLAVTRIAA